MKRYWLFLGSAIALVGALCLLAKGEATVHLVEILTDRIGDPVPRSLVNLPWFVVSVHALAIGFALNCCALAIQDESPPLPMLAMTHWIGSSLALTLGSGVIGWGLFRTRLGFNVLATSGSAPGPDYVEKLMVAGRSISTIGAAIVLIAAAMALVACFLMPASPPPLRKVPLVAQLQWPLAIGALLMGIVLPLVALSLWSNGLTLRSYWETTAKPSDMAFQMIAIWNKSLGICGGLGLLGLLQLMGLFVEKPATPLTSSPDDLPSPSQDSQ